jgi:hypothetical protein
MVKDSYIDKHNFEPRSRTHWINGTEYVVETYTRADRDLIVDAINQTCNEAAVGAKMAVLNKIM